MSHGSYDLNLGSEILVLVGDIRSRICPNTGGTYGIFNVIFTLFTCVPLSTVTPLYCLHLIPACNLKEKRPGGLFSF